MARVLVVDDDLDILNLVSIHLRRAGHEAVSAAAPQEALELVAAGPAPEVAVLDVTLPGMSGLELLKELRTMNGLRKLPVIFLSARVQRDEIEAGRSLGAEYLTKPFVAADLLAAIAQATSAK